ARNGEALAHARRAAAGQGGVTWLAGPSGAGKTHLLQAVCAAAALARRSGYLPLRQLSELGVEVLAGLPQLECLAIDDVDAVIGRGEWERALFTLVREFAERDRGAGARLGRAAGAGRLGAGGPGSRCAAAAVFQLRVLDEPEQREALRLRARLRGLELPPETARWLQRRFPRDMHTLYQLLDTLDEAALAAQRRLTVPFIRAVLAAPRRAEPG
ncbi:DNA replication initiation factor, partial [mine drainage metagenome]